MKNLLIKLLATLFFVMHLNAQYEVPKLDGNWWLIGESSPDVAPYNKLGQNACDFTIYQSSDMKWQLVACIRYTAYPGSTRFFYRWEADSLTQVNWVPKGIFWTTGTKGTPDAMGHQLGVNTPYTIEGTLQAPHCVKQNGKYYMFHNNSGAFCLISDDGRNWTQWKDYKNSAKFFDMGRDVMIFNDLENSGKWYGCFLQNVSGSGAVMAARTADSLKGPWTTSTITIHSEGNPESPFIIKKGNYYYLWEQMHVFKSEDINKGFHGAEIIKMGTGATSDRYAPEILEYKGQYYIAGYGKNGISVCKMKWVPDTDPSLDAYAKNISIAEGTFYPAFDSTVFEYYLTIPNNVTNLTITTTLSKKTLTYANFQNTNIPEGNRDIRVAVNASDKKTSRVYVFNVYRVPATATTNNLTVNNGYQTGIYATGQKVTIIAKVPVGKVFDKWTGDITGIANTNAAKTVFTIPASAVTITATFKDDVKYLLTVNNGTGTDSYYSGSVVNITANAPSSDKIFNKWIGDTKGITDTTKASTTLTMPASNVTITATYKNIPPSYNLTVSDGTGSGRYPEGTKVNITAPAISGKVFDKWTGDVQYITNVSNASASLTMPAKDITIASTYKYVLFVLSVTNGQGEGNFAAGAKVPVLANTAPSGKIFDKWTGDVVYLKNSTDSVNEIVMPTKNVSITATYKAKPIALDEIDGAIAIYPNPADEHIFISLPQEKNGYLTVINASGIKVMEGKISSDQMMINVSRWARGMYVIKITTNSTIYEKIIVVQ